MGKEVKISSWSTTPGLRFRHESPFSGQEFREDVLEPAFKTALEKKEKLIIDFDGTEGYGTSFLEEAFGGLARVYSPQEVIDTLSYTGIESSDFIEEVKGYIADEQERQKK